MARYGMIIDIKKCEGCYNCQIACKDEFVDNDYHPYSASQPETGHFWMYVRQIERGKYPKVKVAYIPQPCMQCDEAPCINAGKDGAVYKRSDGVVIIDPEKSRGQKEIQSSCPYGKIYWNTQLNIPQKCTFCIHLLERGWKEPRCVESCPTGAFIFGDLDDPDSELSNLIQSGKTEFLYPNLKLLPRVHYISLPKNFIACSLVCEDSGECLEGAHVTLTDSSSGKTRMSKSDNYGEVEFEDLDSGRTYLVKIEADGYKTIVLDPIELKRDAYLGEIFMKK